jgi:hypothetical protein
MQVTESWAILSKSKIAVKFRVMSKEVPNDER